MVLESKLCPFSQQAPTMVTSNSFAMLPLHIRRHFLAPQYQHQPRKTGKDSVGAMNTKVNCYRYGPPQIINKNYPLSLSLSLLNGSSSCLQDGPCSKVTQGFLVQSEYRVSPQGTDETTAWYNQARQNLALRVRDGSRIL